MTRKSRTLSAVFMAVLLVLASGTAVSLAVTDSSTTDVGTNAVDVQETTTAADDGNETASVTINEQETDGEQVVVESATLPEGGFIAIHDSSVAEAPLSSVLGNSVYLEPGTHEDVTITLARPIEESQTLVAMPHLDTNDNEVYDFVLSTGELDGPYTVDNEVLVDQANVTVAQETTTEEEVETTTTEEDVVETTTEEEVVETTTEEDVVETTTEEEDVVETTTEEEDVVETTTEEEEVVETTTEEEDVVETTTEEEVEEPADEQQLVFKVEEMQIDEWSFVVGDEETPDRTETIGNVTVQDERVEINLTELLQQQQDVQGQMTTMSPEEAQEQLEENLSQDLETVRIVIQNVNVENVTLVITAPEGMELPEPPMTTTEEEEEVETTTEEEEVVETTTEEEEVETTTEEEEEVETTTEEEDVVETTTEEEEEAVETTTEEEEAVETTTEEEEAVETTTEEEEAVETTTEEEEEVETTTEEETTAEAELDSFEVSELDAPESATTGDTITVSASVSNPNDQEATQEVAFRLEGTVIDRQSVTLDAGEQTTVTFEIGTEGVPAGQYVHGVYTRDFGDLAVITLEEPEETDDATETPAGDETTTTAVTTEA